MRSPRERIHQKGFPLGGAQSELRAKRYEGLTARDLSARKIIASGSLTALQLAPSLEIRFPAGKTYFKLKRFPEKKTPFSKVRFPSRKTHFAACASTYPMWRGWGPAAVADWWVPHSFSLLLISSSSSPASLPDAAIELRLRQRSGAPASFGAQRLDGRPRR